jgi:hypothetical protein
MRVRAPVQCAALHCVLLSPYIAFRSILIISSVMKYRAFLVQTAEKRIEPAGEYKTVNTTTRYPTGRERGA